MIKKNLVRKMTNKNLVRINDKLKIQLELMIK